MILRILICFISVYFCLAHNGYNKTIPKAFLKIDVKEKGLTESLITPGIKRVICSNTLEEYSYPNDNIRFEILVTIDKFGKVIPYNKRKWVDTKKMARELKYLSTFAHRTDAELEFEIFNDNLSNVDAELPFNIIYVRCKCSNKLGTSISNTVSFYLDILDSVKFKKCDAVIHRKSTFYYGNSFYYACKDEESKCDYSDVNDVKWVIVDDADREITLQHLMSSNAAFSSISAFFFNKRGIFYYSNPQLKLLEILIQSRDMKLFCETKKFNKRIYFNFGNRKNETNTHLRSYSYPRSNKDVLTTNRFKTIAGSKILYYHRICPTKIEVTFQGSTPRGIPIVRECKSPSQTMCCFVSNTGLTFRGSRINFDYIDRNGEISYTDVVDISAAGEINFRYTCKDHEKNTLIDTIDVTIKVVNDPIFLDHQSIQTKDIDLFVNKSLEIDYNEEYNTTIYLNSKRDKYQSNWYINGVSERGTIDPLSRFSSINKYEHLISKFNPDRLTFNIGYDAVGKYTIVNNAFSVNFYVPITISFITASRNFTRSELIGSTIKIACEINYDPKMNVMMIWKKYSLGYAKNEEEKVEPLRKKICYGDSTSCRFEHEFQVLPEGNSAGEYRCVAESLIPSLKYQVAAKSVFLSATRICFNQRLCVNDALCVNNNYCKCIGGYNGLYCQYNLINITAYELITDIISKPVVIIESNNWWIFLLIALLLFILMIVLCCCICLQRNKGQEYSVDEKERKNGNDPERELLESFFQDYQRPEGDPVKGSRASLSSTIKMGSDGSSMAEYGEIDPGKFNEDGSFLNIYNDDKKNHTNV